MYFYIYIIMVYIKPIFVEILLLCLVSFHVVLEVRCSDCVLWSPRVTNLSCHCHRFDTLLGMAKSLMSNQRLSGEVGEKVKRLNRERQALNEAAVARSSQLLQCHQLQLFYRDAEQVDGTTANQEAFLANEDLGVRVG